MKASLIALLKDAMIQLKSNGTLPETVEVEPKLERTRSKEHGDFASNLAMMLAKPAAMPPRKLAELILEKIPESGIVEKIEIAGPGFINFSLKQASQFETIQAILEAGEQYGQQQSDEACKVTLEFVSANPTGPLHVGHGRGAAYGDALARILKACGYTVQTEYYVNDAGRQMHILACSVWLRYLEIAGESIRFPDNGYRGDYISDIAQTLYDQHSDQWRKNWSEIRSNIVDDEAEGGDKEKHIDGLIQQAKTLLGEQGYELFFKAALDGILEDIKQDLSGFNVNYDNWFSERSLFDSGALQKGLDALEAEGALFKQDGATWFAASRFGDDKDRVVVRENGDTTYFASDIAYFLNKLDRGFEKTLYVFGADHHGYVPRLRAVASGLGKDPDVLEIPLIQFAALYRGGEKVQMSTRSGQFVTLRELREEVGTDAARFFYVMRSHEQHLDFDLDLAKSRSNENPVYTIQYAHARVCSIAAQMQEKGYDTQAAHDNQLALLDSDAEKLLITQLARYPEILGHAARKRSPHSIAQYLRELTQAFHSWYNGHPVLSAEPDLRTARFSLANATRQVVSNGLSLIGVSAPDRM